MTVVVRGGVLALEARGQPQFESKVGSQLFLFQISAILLIPLRALKTFFLQPPSGPVSPSWTRTHFGAVTYVSSER